MLKAATYWKCQVAGWTGYSFVCFFFGLAVQIYYVTLLEAVLQFAFAGVLTSHLMRHALLKAKLLQKPIHLQLFYLLGATFLFSLLFVLLFGIVEALLHLYKLNLDVRNVLFARFCIAFITLLVWNLVYFLYHYVKWIVEEEKQKVKMHLQMLELEAKALRAQMNPHFVFNCLNSIKSLIQQKDEDKAINYLTTFSKLIRTIFHHSDKREVTLFDEIETCKLYVQLESMRFGNKFSYLFCVDETLDLKSIQVPALIVQPFIENAIWHGIVPKEEGGCVNVAVKRENENICCIVDDNGIGRETSMQNKFKGDPSTHQSKGVHLTQSRLDLDSTLNERNATLEIVDKKDENEKAAGTRVILRLQDY